MNEKYNREKMDTLMKAVLSLESLDECYAFFEDLCTISELQAMEQRYHVALLLTEGYVYNKIAEETGASPATISRVNRSLAYGSDGYKRVIKKQKI